MNTFKAQGVSDFYQKVADGGEAQLKIDGEWSNLFVGGPAIGSNKDVWRIKPAKKVIDLSVLIESGIDCEFSDALDFDEEALRIGFLTSINCSGYPYSLGCDVYFYCRPRVNHIHAWQGGECPLPEGFIVRLTKWSVHVPHISHIELTTKQWISSKANEHTTVQAFEVLGVADGYVMPWEQDNE